MANADLTSARRIPLKRPSEVTPEILRHVFDYRPETGEFIWKTPRHKPLVGKVAGCTRSDGYVLLQVCGTQMFAHRAAWLYVHGELPSGMVLDHINCDRADNRIANLRVADNSENAWNRCNKQDASGVQQISKGRYGALIAHRGERRWLGSYQTKEAGEAAFKAAATALRGEFYTDQ